MTSLHTADKKQPPWMRRLLLPAYQVKEAARYAGITSQTILNWQGSSSTIGGREKGSALSYFQLIEVAVVAALRKAGVSLNTIKITKNYVAQRLNSEFPFAQHTFKTDGKDLIMALRDFDAVQPADKLIVVSRNGQLAWGAILDRLKEFEYDKSKGVAVKWHLDGTHSPIIIDPQVSFGAPAVKGVPTWTIKGRLEAGESIDEIADDFLLDAVDVKKALQFEGIDINSIANTAWSH
jgi:uncharacterized protein (DUF433 family)